MRGIGPRGAPLLKLVEQCAGIGEVTAGARVFKSVAYRIERFQGMAASGMPVPGRHRIEGSVDVAAIPEPSSLVGSTLALKLADGKSVLYPEKTFRKFQVGWLIRVAGVPDNARLG